MIKNPDMELILNNIRTHSWLSLFIPPPAICDRFPPKQCLYPEEDHFDPKSAEGGANASEQTYEGGSVFPQLVMVKIPDMEFILNNVRISFVSVGGNRKNVISIPNPQRQRR